MTKNTNKILTTEKYNYLLRKICVGSQYNVIYKNTKSCFFYVKDSKFDHNV